RRRAAGRIGCDTRPHKLLCAPDLRDHCPPRPKGRYQFTIEAGRCPLRTDHHRPVVDVLAGSADHTPVVVEFEIRMTPAANGLRVPLDIEFERDRRIFVATRRDECGVELGRRPVGFDPEDAIAGRRQEIVARECERARVACGDVFVSACANDFSHTRSRRERHLGIRFHDGRGDFEDRHTARAMERAHRPPSMELDEWTAAAVDPGEDVPDPDEWVAVDIPGTPARFSGEHAVAYRTQFSDPGGPRARLRLRGLYANARIWLDGEHVGTHDTYFTPFETVFDPEERNELVVECRAPEDRFGGVFEAPFVPPENSVPTIRWGASVEPVPEIALTDLTVRPDETDEPGINAIVTVDAGTELDGRIRLSAHPADEDGASALSQVGVTAAAGERVTVQGRLSVRDPDRWWPRGVGSQHRYTVRAALGESERAATTGFRTVEGSREGLFVNGTRIPVRGRVALPAADPERATEPIERAVETNATLVRLYGHVPPESVYDAAAEAAILLCQDVPMNRRPLDAARPRRIARELGGKCGLPASRASFGGHDDASSFDATTEKTGQRVRRATGGGERAASATAAAGALPDSVPAFAVPGLDSES